MLHTDTDLNYVEALNVTGIICDVLSILRWLAKIWFLYVEAGGASPYVPREAVAASPVSASHSNSCQSDSLVM